MSITFWWPRTSSPNWSISDRHTGKIDFIRNTSQALPILLVLLKFSTKSILTASKTFFPWGLSFFTWSWENFRSNRRKTWFKPSRTRHITRSSSSLRKDCSMFGTKKLFLFFFLFWIEWWKQTLWSGRTRHGPELSWSTCRCGSKKYIIWSDIYSYAFALWYDYLMNQQDLRIWRCDSWLIGVLSSGSASRSGSQRSYRR